jgi:hypothetical protein
MEDNFKILKVEYLRNHWSDLRNLAMEDDLKISKVEYLSIASKKKN